MLTSLNTFQSTKRSEENQKFVFKRCLKALKKKLRKNYNIKKKKRDFERFFFDFYFKESSERHKIPIEKFFPPKDSKRKRQLPKKMRSISLTYINNVTLSESFHRDFVNYLNEDFVKDHSKTIEEKLSALVIKWETEFINSAMKPSVIEAISLKIETCPKYKLPWTLKEIEAAICFVQSLLASSTE
jgi:hypothetical protein